MKSMFDLENGGFNSRAQASRFFFTCLEATDPEM